MAGQPKKWAALEAAALERGDPPPERPERPKSSGHPVGCMCGRCRGFQKGHKLGVVHGAFAPDLYAQESEYIAGLMMDALGDMVGPLDEFAVRMCAVALARSEYAARYMERRRRELERDGGVLSVEEYEQLERLGEHAIRWMTQARRWMGDLGMTPSSRAKLLRDAGVGKAAVVRADSELRAYLERRPGSEGGPVVEGQSSLEDDDESAVASDPAAG